MAAVQVCDHLRVVVRGLLGIALPTQIVATAADLPYGEDGKLRLDNGLLARRYKRLVEEMTMLVDPGKKDTGHAENE